MLREQLAAKDAKLAELTLQLEKFSAMSISPNKSGDKVIGLYWNKAGTIMREVYEGKLGAIYTETSAGSKQSMRDLDLTVGEWKEMPAEQVYARIKEHKEKFGAMKALSPLK